ncbi:serine aminopeptidase domain-containing protein [Maricaulis salignorans]|uniref:alpha/beta hydrolase family protein n=1 Tax=Maricaulis salignorans TaxID=144026 RepID=UPI003A90C697
MTAIIHESEIRFNARDGYELSGLIIAPDAPKAAVLVSSGTGFPKELYRRLARQGAAMGYACLLYDYRGIGASAPRQMKGFQADIVDWGRLDFAAALDRAQALAPEAPLYTLGHSVGGHLPGFADNGLKPAAHALVSCGTGYWGAHEPGYKPTALFFWLVYGPACLALTGHIPSGGGWGGTALPRGVFEQWRRWAFKPGYFGDELGALGPHCFDRITAPICDWTFTDDTLASRRAALDLLAIYTAAETQLLRLEPGEIGAPGVGHFGAFKQAAQGFWPMPFSWFDQVSHGAGSGPGRGSVSDAASTPVP